MSVVFQIALLYAVDDGEVHADGSSLFVLIDTRTLVLVPSLNIAVAVLGKIVFCAICLASLFRPVQSVQRAVIVGVTGIPIVHNHVVLQVVAPDDGIFQVATVLDFIVQINRLVGQLMPGVGESVMAHPDAAATIDHDKRAILALGKRAVGEAGLGVFASNQNAVALVIQEFARSPRIA